jgi:hypothetical protein
MVGRFGSGACRLWIAEGEVEEGWGDGLCWFCCRDVLVGTDLDFIAP